MHDKFKVVQIIVCTVVNIFLFIFEYSTLFVDYKQHFFIATAIFENSSWPNKMLATGSKKKEP